MVTAQHDALAAYSHRIIEWIAGYYGTTMQIGRQHKRIRCDPFHEANRFRLSVSGLEFLQRFVFKAIGKIAIEINTGSIVAAEIGQWWFTVSLLVRQQHENKKKWNDFLNKMEEMSFLYLSLSTKIAHWILLLSSIFSYPVRNINQNKKKQKHCSESSTPGAFIVCRASRSSYTTTGIHIVQCFMVIQKPTQT